MKNEQRIIRLGLVAFLIIVFILISIFGIDRPEDKGYTDQPSPSIQSVEDVKDADVIRYITKYKEGNFLMLKWEDPDNGTICYAHGEAMFCFGNEDNL